MLHPYKGTRQDEHFGRTAYDDAGLNINTYSFNSLGFRGEEFDPDAPVKLFVCGCSITFGIELELEESWPFLFKQKLATHRSLPASCVNLLNFSEAGASNDYITRTLVEQSARVRPDLIVAGFTQMHRFELLDESTSFRFNPPMLNVYVKAGGKFADMAKLMEFVFLGTDEIQKQMRMIKNMLLLQYFCRSRNIPFLFLFFEAFVGKDLESLLSSPMTRPLYEEIDLDSVVPLTRATDVDRTSDQGHPGPRSSELIADTVWKSFQERFSHGKSSVGDVR
jgi:hypothetical protein